MRYSPASKYEIIRTVEESALGISRTCEKLGISRSTFYNWYDRYLSGGYEALADQKPRPADVSATLKDGLKAAGLSRKHRPRLLSDNGPCYISGELKGWLADNGMTHTRGKPYHPMTQGKIERWHRTMKDKVLLENYYLPSELESRIGEFINHYNTRRYHESLNNLTPEDVWLGRGETILQQRRNIKAKTMNLRKQLYVAQKAA